MKCMKEMKLAVVGVVALFSLLSVPNVQAQRIQLSDIAVPSGVSNGFVLVVHQEAATGQLVFDSASQWQLNGTNTFVSTTNALAFGQNAIGSNNNSMVFNSRAVVYGSHPSTNGGSTVSLSADELWLLQNGPFYSRTNSGISAVVLTISNLVYLSASSNVVTNAVVVNVVTTTNNTIAVQR